MHFFYSNCSFSVSSRLKLLHLSEKGELTNLQMREHLPRSTDDNVFSLSLNLGLILNLLQLFIQLSQTLIDQRFGYAFGKAVI